MLVDWPDMHEREVVSSRVRFLALSLLSLCLLLLCAPNGPAKAHWLTKLAREAGEAGGSAARHVGKGLDDIGGLSRHLKSLPNEPKTTALAAHATPEGHWKFTNRDGEVFTAANAEEMARMMKALAPAHAADGKLKLFLSEDTIFERPYLVKDLPADAELHLLSGNASHRLKPDAGGKGFLAEVKPNLHVSLSDRRLFDEAMWRLKRPLSKSSIRVVSLEPGAAQTLTTAPRFDAQTKAAMIDRIDPWKLPAALSSIKQQTLIVTGRIEGEFLHFRPSSGGEKSLLIDDLRRAAKDADVNLVVLQAKDPLQPGGRNWFWQKVEVKGLDEALKQADFADFLNALGSRRQGMIVEAREGMAGRIALDVRPGASGASPSTPISDRMAHWTGEIFSQALGNVITDGIKADVPDKDRQDDLDHRIIPGVPFLAQAGVLFSYVFALAGIAYLRRWWLWLWPLEDRSEYASAFGYHAARTVRLLLFVIVFMPLLGLPAGLWAILKGFFEQVWFIITLPVRVLRWIWRRIVPARA